MIRDSEALSGSDLLKVVGIHPYHGCSVGIKPGLVAVVSNREEYEQSSL